MLTRQRRKASQKAAALQEAKRILAERGWSYRSAGPVLKVRFEHLCRVLNGQRISASLLKRIEGLPPAPERKAPAA